MGKSQEKDISKLIHTTRFDILYKVNAGQINPIQATMDGDFAVEGDTQKLMACAPLIPITVKAHDIAMTVVKKSNRDPSIKKRNRPEPAIGLHWQIGVRGCS